MSSNQAARKKLITYFFVSHKNAIQGLRFKMSEILLDRKSNCYSIVAIFSLKDYLNLVAHSYNEGGGLEGQRKAITTKSARRIRNRMVEDFVNGAVLPPVVIGIASKDLYGVVNESPEEFSLEDGLRGVNEEEIAIIDGMQRTTAMYDAYLKATDEKVREKLSERKIRVEFWVARETSSLIYRMLVLNTGQVPWNLRRQIEVIMRPLKTEIEREVPGINLIGIDENEYRKNPGNFQADRVLELYLIFASRTEKIDAKEQVAEEYARLDIIETSSRESVISMFCELLKRVVRFDYILWGMEKESGGRFREGKDFLNSQPVLASLVSVFSQFMLGRPGWDNDSEKVRKKEAELYGSFDGFLGALENQSPEGLREFMEFDTVNEMISKMRGGKVGDMERDFFRGAFRVLLEERFTVPNMGVCWRS
ncbi:hypothetical protein [Halomonas nitroreducens]|uniref:DUF262 domain-containing protein n=1 Tax=Halomonas nitroreducens TaxID=447425 RepID=A0A3S0HP87_9GAMM|nr:hypothetical protein [Halomonas nitroreducens]RTQ97196.1 hypothetical protein EKG36_20295 [Halomonas nitroreducens]